MSRIDEIKIELEELIQARDDLYKAVDYYESIDWPAGIQKPHHVEMEIYEVLCEIEEKIQEIEDKLETI
jgi:hypothetical protein